MSKDTLEEKIKVSGPEELQQGKQQLAERLNLIWEKLEQDPKASITFPFDFGSRESWFRETKNQETGEPTVGYADRGKLAILGSIAEVVNHFVKNREDNFWDLYGADRLRRTWTGEAYQQGEPKELLNAANPQEKIEDYKKAIEEYKRLGLIPSDSQFFEEKPERATKPAIEKIYTLPKNK